MYPYFLLSSDLPVRHLQMIWIEEYNINEQDLNRIISPIGLEIKAETPAEIAISITGQMIQVRADRKDTSK